ncbi:MAG: acetyltransferase [Gammaproteobacteria bacterium SG8_11]|nr:MAG: acetyltransferase [Gammaproteobacteria bacterium SG8_11]
MSGNEHVILVHGLARSHRSFTKVAKALEKNGYPVVNINYPSRKHHIEALADEYLSSAVKTCQADGAQRIHFVTHSMGAILVRYYLNQYTLDELGHVVMLSPPNQGSEVVDKLKAFPGFYALNGPAGQQLGTSKNSLPNRLGAVDYPVGVITGNRSINPILSLLIPGKDDGKVSVERAKIQGMSDFLVVPHTHPMIMNSREVIRQTQYFLRSGKFFVSQKLIQP